MERETLIAYACSFASFLLDSRAAKNINKIILFGSVARGDFDKESDIDIFVDANKDIESEVNRTLILFESSKAYEAWKLRGVKNEISVKAGSLKKWSLRREIISSGILLYGKYNEVPENVKYYLLVKMDMRKIKAARQMSIWRKLYGYKQKIGKKTYTGKGLVEKCGGKKLGKAIILVPMDARKEVMDYLNKNRISCTINEIWSDTL